MKYAVVANAPIDIDLQARKYLQRQARLRRQKGTVQYRREQARRRRLRNLQRA